jgi:hypothetical protein
VREDISFRIEGIGLAFESLCSLAQTGDLLADQHLTPFPPLGLSDHRDSPRFPLPGAPVGFLGRRQFLGGRCGKPSNGLLRRIFLRRRKRCR